MVRKFRNLTLLSFIIFAFFDVFSNQAKRNEQENKKNKTENSNNKKKE